MTEKRPTLTLKPKAKASAAGRGAARPGQNKAGPARPKGPGGPAKGAPARPAAAPVTQTAAPSALDESMREPVREAGRDSARDSARLRQSHEVKVPVQLDYRPALKADSLAFALLGAASSL